jgi:hypothetical protein
MVRRRAGASPDPKPRKPQPVAMRPSRAPASQDPTVRWFVADVVALEPTGLACSVPPVPLGAENESLPRIGTFGHTDTLGYLIDRPSPAPISLFHGLERGIPGLGLEVVIGHRRLYGLTRAH